ncbi:MAG: hypothetical protein AB8B99_22735 [Phormidesmis sp.]
MTLTSGGKRHERNIETAQSWCHDFLLTELTTLLPQSSLDEPAIRRYLWNIIQSDSEHALHARLCLRCWISHQIAGACAKLSSKFGQKYGFTTIDLLPFVLDDDGTLEPSFSPFSLEILSQYDESKSSLSTWSYRKTEGHRDINLFLLDKGLYRISDWAILNDTPPDRLQRIFVGVDGQTLQEKVTLLQAFHQVYRRDRMQARLQTGSASRCLEPTPQQLSQIAHLIETKSSPGSDLNRILSQLCDLATELRRHRIAARRKTPVTQSLQALEETGYDLPQPDDSDSENEFLQRYRTSFLEGLNDAIKAITFKKCENYQKRNPSKAHLFVTALRLFHCEGLSMTVIAKVLDLPSQTAISRLIGLKQFRAEICAYWLNHLQENVRLEILQTMTSERLSQISQQVDAILAEETEAVMAEAAAEAQMPKNRTCNSTFSRHLCQELSGSTPS